MYAWAIDLVSCLRSHAILVDVRDSRTHQAEKGVFWAFPQAAWLRWLPLLAIRDPKGAIYTWHTLKTHLQGKSTPGELVG